MAQLLRVRTVLTYGLGSPGLSTVYYQGVGAATAAQATEAVGRVRAFWTAAQSRISNTTTAQVDGAVDVLEDTDGSLVGGFSVTTPTPQVGPNAVSLGPLASCAMIRFNTAAVIDGKRLRGRMFMPPSIIGDISAGQLLDTSRVSLQGNAQSLTTLILTAVSHVVWSRPRAASLTLPARAGSAAAVTSYTVPSKLAVLRSRRD